MPKIRSDDFHRYVRDLVSETFENLPAEDRPSKKEEQPAEKNHTHSPIQTD